MLSIGNITTSGSVQLGGFNNIIGGKITINGKNYQELNGAKNIKVIADGHEVIIPVEEGFKFEITCEKVGEVKLTSGNMDIKGNVQGNVHVSAGNIKVEGEVGGDATTTSGNITAQTIGGNAKTTMGNITGNKRQK